MQSYTITALSTIFKENTMIQVGDKLPGGKLWELAGEWENTCSLGANDVDIEQAVSGKRIVLFGVPAAFTKT
jgi:peroxiredoxin